MMLANYTWFEMSQCVPLKKLCSKRLSQLCSFKRCNTIMFFLVVPRCAADVPHALSLSAHVNKSNHPLDDRMELIYSILMQYTFIHFTYL